VRLAAIGGALLVAACGATAKAPPSVGPSAPSKPSTPRQKTSPFHLWLEQDGKKVAVANHRAWLKLGRFAIVIDSRDPEVGILMNVSLKPDLFREASSGEPIASYFQPGTGMAEEARVKREILFVVSGKYAHHYLIYEPEQQVSRFHRVEKVGKRYRCRRIVAELMTEDRKERSLADLRPTALYLVLFRGVNVMGKTLEHHRDFVELRFR
jgi:hypothetical protein